MPRLLIIEDSVMMQKAIKHVASTELDCEFDLADCLKATQQLVAKNDYYLALADLNLPDAPNGEVIDFLIGAGITTIVLTASMDDKKRNMVLQKGVLDYIYKESRDSYYHAVKLSNQILQNKQITVLLADDSTTLRSHIRKQLQKMLFNVIEAVNGLEALDALEKHPEIELLITDFNMPKMDGIDLIRTIRKTKSRDQFPIIGLSSSMDPTLSAQFIKYGANDFLVTPFIHEEFQWRILKTIEQNKLIKKITDSANQDFLTKLYNRRYFFNIATPLHIQAQQKQSPLVVGMVDIDFFKKINDNYGHDSGDAVLVQISALLTKYLTHITLARYGGEEFIILIKDITQEKCATLFELLRKKIETTVFVIPDGNIQVTISLGAAKIENVLATNGATKPTLEDLINKADEALYKAKNSGRNKVVFH